MTNVKNAPQEVFLDFKLDQDPESERHETVQLKEKEWKVVIKDLVRGVDMKTLGQKALKSREVDLNRSRNLDVVVWDGPGRGRRLTTKRFRFHHIDVDAYATMLPVYYMNERVNVSVRHVATDPGKGFIEDVVASVAGINQLATAQGDGLGPPVKIGKNDSYDFWFGVDPATPKVPFSVKVGKKSNAFAGTLTINAGGEDKEKDKGKDKAKEKEAEGTPQ